MSSAVSSTNVPSTPILVTTPSTDTKASFNDHRHDDSSDDQRQLNKQNSNKTYTRVSKEYFSVSSSFIQETPNTRLRLV